VATILSMPAGKRSEAVGLLAGAFLAVFYVAPRFDDTGWGHERRRERAEQKG
jgi:hypothetical protein